MTKQDYLKITAFIAGLVILLTGHPEIALSLFSFMLGLQIGNLK